MISLSGGKKYSSNYLDRGLPHIQRRASNAEALQIAFLSLIVSFTPGPVQEEELPYIMSSVLFPTEENDSLACCVNAKFSKSFGIQQPLLRNPC